MTSEKPQIVKRTRRSEMPAPRKFSFTRDQVPTIGDGSQVAEYRQVAWQQFETLPMPSSTDEAWRRTDFNSLTIEQLRMPVKDAYLDLAPLPDHLLKPLADGEHAGEVVMLPGGAQVRLAEELAQKGVIFTDIRTAEQRYPAILQRFMAKALVKPEAGKFAALSLALANTGVLLYIPRGVAVEQPLHSLLWAPGPGLAHISNVLVWLEDGASATLVHESASPDENGQAMHAGTVEIFVGNGANLRFVELQSFGEHMYNFTHERVQVAENGTLDWVFGAIGGKLTKNFSDLDLVGRGATGRMSGFYFTEHNQHLDYDSQQNHLAPNTTSDLLFKGALVDQSRAVWQGMVYVAPDAQKTDGYQANRNLILSHKAHADSIPGLEILADDVRCTHGATIGKIDQDQIFYLRSRGIPKVEAERLIVEGFFDPIMQRIPFEGVRQRFQEAIHEKMASYKGY
jgi:Fe-S cluster assembly protein SufD